MKSVEERLDRIESLLAQLVDRQSQPPDERRRGSRHRTRSGTVIGRADGFEHGYTAEYMDPLTESIGAPPSIDGEKTTWNFCVNPQCEGRFVWGPAKKGEGALRFYCTKRCEFRYWLDRRIGAEPPDPTYTRDEQDSPPAKDDEWGEAETEPDEDDPLPF